MASTERRRSLSLPFAPFFSFRSDSKSDKTPRLRRKLQKVTKATEADACTAAETSDRPLTQVSDGAFLSIKYEARQPGTATRPATGHGRSSSSSRPATASTPSRHSVVIGGLPHPQLQPQSQFQPAAAAAAAAAETETEEAQRQKTEKKMQAETQARAMAMVDAQERAQTKTKPVPLPLMVPQSVPRHHPQFHRPHQLQPVTPYGRHNGSAYSFSARHSMAASIVSSSSPSSPSSMSLLSSPSTMSTVTSTQSFTPSYSLPWSPPRSSSSLITPPSSSCSSQQFPSPYGSVSPSRAVPELSHLGSNSSQSQNPNQIQIQSQNRYKGLSGATSTALDSPKSDVSNASSTSFSQARRKPKTPVYVIGQLESGSSDDQSTQATQSQQQQPQHQQKMSQTSSAALGIQTPPESPMFVAATTMVAAEMSLLQSKSSIECIAEQYRALLSSRNSMLTDAHSVLEPEPEGDDDKPVRRHGHLVPKQRRFMLSPPSANKKDTAESVSESVSTVSPLPSPLFPRRVGQSPMHNSAHSNGRSTTAALPNYSKKGTSMHKLATPPPSPPASQPQSQSQSQSQPHNLSLQICLDLLTRELSSAVADRHMMSTGLRGGSATTAAAPALQILVMIEAYERLRDQLVDEARRKRNGSSGEVEAMFSLWLQSLYKIHDSLTSSSANDKYDEDGQISESAYDSAEDF